LWSQLQHEISREPLGVAFDCTVQRTGFHTVEHGQIGIKQYLFTTDKKDKLGQIFWLGNELSHGRMGVDRAVVNAGIHCQRH
jgi:hypothetical protein